MKFLMMIDNDDSLLDALPAGEFDALMRGWIEHADVLRDEGLLVDSQQIEARSSARALGVRDGRTTIVDGPFTRPRNAWAAST